MIEIFPNVPLASFTTFRVGGPARFLINVNEISDLKSAINFALSKKLSYFVIGGGSNLLVSDEGYDGVVIKLNINGIEFPESNLVIAGASEHWDTVVATSISKNLAGIENLSWIPGSVGAAPVQNIGAYGTEIREVIEWVEVFDPKIMNVRTLLNSECRFGYRDSFFKTEEGRALIVTRVAMRLSESGKPNLSYKDLANYFVGKKQPTPLEVRNVVIDIRKNKLPDITKIGTAGSFFKNPIVTEERYTELAGLYPGLPFFPAYGGFKKIPLAWILDKVCNFNGYREGNVGLYKTQPLALVNFGGGTSIEIKKLADKIFNEVKNKTGIEIEWEVIPIGFL